jgi:Neprosin
MRARRRVFLKSTAVIIGLSTALLASSATVGPTAYAKPLNLAENVAYSQKGFPGSTASNVIEPNATTTYLCGSAFSCYYYVGANQWGLSATGASVAFTQAKPTVGANDFHSVTELAVESSDGRQIVEVGWIVTQNVNGDNLPHLFVFHWVNGNATCYNGCGFVPVSTPVPAGGVVSVGTIGKFKIQFKNNRWQIIYNGYLVGYFPESIWGGSFTKAFEVQVFGEVCGSPTTYPKTQMGNGILGSKLSSAIIKNYALLGSTIAPALSPYGINVNYTSYTYSNATATSLHYGGPGY